MVQSAPASIEAGDPTAVRWHSGCSVSIRARFNRSGRPPAVDPFGMIRCFNPRPLQSKRATRTKPRSRVSLQSFNPRPLQSKRATTHGADAALLRTVSIRARFNRSGRRRALPSFVSIAAFQSAPASIEAGDRAAWSCRSNPSCFNPRPLQSKRATLPGGTVVPLREFQSAPASIEAGDSKEQELSTLRVVSIRARFNRSGRPSGA